MPKLKPTWIAVMDGSLARFFVLRRGEEGQVFEEAGAPLSARRKAPRDRSERKDIDTNVLSREVAGALDAALAERKYDHLVLVAPPRQLSELREALTARVRATLAHQVPKNFAGLGIDALWQKLSTILVKAARPVNATAERVPTVSGNALPVSVVFRNMEASTSVQVAALKYAAKLGRKFGRIQNCRVTVEAPKHVHRKVKEFRVAIDMKLPGREIATKAASSDGAADLGTALREAFATATRQLQDHVHRIKDEVVRERRLSAPRNAA
jgi:protein required for attachment to host cells/ribosome-associated translation inhibitor RaiA